MHKFCRIRGGSQFVVGEVNCVASTGDEHVILVMVVEIHSIILEKRPFPMDWCIVPLWS